MIKTKTELDFFIMADRIMNGFSQKISLKERMLDLIKPNPIIKYLKHMRCQSYYKTRNKFLYVWHGMMYRKIGIKLGFSISAESFGYGLVIPHWGTIVVSSDVRAGNYCVLHTSTCLGGGKKLIGNGLYLSAGAKIFKSLNLGNNVTISPNTLVMKSFDENNITLSGCPAKITRSETKPWWERDGDVFVQRHQKVEDLKKKMNL